MIYDYIIQTIGNTPLIRINKLNRNKQVEIFAKLEGFNSKSSLGEAFKLARSLIREEGIFAGMSSGAAMYAAIEIAEKVESGRIVVIFPDRAEKYLSTKLFEDIN